MNKILAVDSSTNLLSICLKAETSYFEITLDCGLKHSENILKQIDHLVEASGIQVKDLDLLICSEGPGSFTGLRIGMSTIKGMATALSIPYTTVPTLDCLAKGYDYFPGAVVPVIDAKKKRFYCAIYEKGRKISQDLDIPVETLLNRLKEYNRVLLTGPDCMMINKEGLDRIFRDENYNTGRSRQLLELGLTKFTQHGPSSIHSGPVYIRKSEAEIAMFGE